jgi:hypothetical protein
MTYRCRARGCTESQAIADERTLGLQVSFKRPLSAARSQRWPMNSGWRGYKPHRKTASRPITLRRRWNVTGQKLWRQSSFDIRAIVGSEILRLALMLLSEQR